MRDRTRQEVAEHVDAPGGVVLDARSAEVRKPLKRGEGEPGAHEDQPARAEARDDERTGPDGEKHGDGRAERDRLLRPAVIGPEGVEEEGDVVVRKAARDTERQKTAGDDPRAAKTA